MTERLVSAGGLLGIPVQDHVILGQGGAYSFRGKGQMPKPAGPRLPAGPRGRRMQPADPD